MATDHGPRTTNDSLRLVMMGTGTFALPTFRALYGTKHRVVGLFTQPEREGPGRRRHRNPMKETALEHGTPVFQPENVNTPAALAELRSLSPDLCIVAAYGQILSDELLQIARLGAINIHASLLPKYRGAAPVQHAILSGETETGITVIQIVPKLDAGPILGMESTPIGPRETAGELESRLAEIAVPLTLRVVDRFEAGTVEPVPQEASRATRAPRLKKSSGLIYWSRSPEEIARHVRAMQPWPTAFTFLKQPGKGTLRLIITGVEPAELEGDAEAGAVLVADGKRLVVQAGGGSVEIVELRPEGKRAMAAAEFLRGHAVREGDRLVDIA